MRIKIKTLPTTVYVKIEKDDNADWLNTAKYAEDHAEIGNQNRVGVYKLYEIRDVEGIVQSKAIKRRVR